MALSMVMQLEWMELFSAVHCEIQQEMNQPCYREDMAPKHLRFVKDSNERTMNFLC